MATKLPGTRIEISDQRVSTPSTQDVKVLLAGVKLPAGTLAPNTPKQVFSESEVIEAAGEGSQLLQMYRYARGINARVNMTVVAMDAPAGAQAAGTLTFGGLATTAQPVIVQIEDETISIPVTIGDDGAAIAASAQTIIAGGEYDFLHVAATTALAVTTLTARNDGAYANEINVKAISVPPGVTLVIVGMAGGTGAPDVDSALASLGGVRYNYIALPDTDATNLADVDTFLADRWTADKAIDGHAVGAKRDSVANLAVLGLGLDTKHTSIFGDPNLPSSPWCQAAAICSLRATVTNPKVTLRNSNLSSLVAPLETEYLDPDDMSTLLDAGIAVYWYVQNVPRVNRFPTLAKTNDLGQSSEAFYDVETKLTVSAIRQERIRVLSPQIGKILVDDASSTEYDLSTAGQIIDAEGIRQILITQYRDDFTPQGWVSDSEGFEFDLIVTKTASDQVTFISVPRITGNLYDIPGTIEFVQATG